MLAIKLTKKVHGKNSLVAYMTTKYVGNKINP